MPKAPSPITFVLEKFPVAFSTVANSRSIQRLVCFHINNAIISRYLCETPSFVSHVPADNEGYRKKNGRNGANNRYGCDDGRTYAPGPGIIF